MNNKHCFTIISLLLASLPAYAHITSSKPELQADGEMELYLSMSLEELMQLEITGSTLTPKSLSSVPSSVTVFNHDQIKRMGLDSLDELINIVPGFQSYRNSRSSLNSTVSSRGRRIASTSAEILLMIDGRRMNDPRTSGSIYLMPKIPLMQIERVEFIRGPGSAVYGSNAMLGVINIITRNEANEIGASIGSINRRQVYLLGSQQTGKLSIDWFAYYDKDGGEDFSLPDTFSPPGQTQLISTDDPRELSSVNLKLKWKGTHFNIQHNRAQVSNFYEQNNISNDFNQRITEFSSMSLKQEFNWQTVDSFVRISFSDSRFFNAVQFTSAATASALSGGAGDVAFFASGDFKDFSETQVQWHNDWKINYQSSLQFGVELRHIDGPEIKARSNYNLEDLVNRNFPIEFYGDFREVTPVFSESNRNIVGVYAQYQQQILENTHMTLGLRYDDFSDIGSEVSPRIGFVQTLNSRHSIKLLYGEAFRAPTETELNFLNNPVVIGNPDLKPETVKTWDLIWLGQWSHTSFSLGYFENHFKNSIIQEDVGGGASQFKNVDQEPGKGFEFEVSHQLNEKWLLRTTYTNFTDTPDSSDDEAHQFVSAMINYQRRKWNANLIATYFDQRSTLISNNRTALDDYWQAYGKLTYNISDRFQAYIQAKNLLDENFQTPTASKTLTVGTANRGREILSGISWKF